MHTSFASDEDVALFSPSDAGPLFPEDQVIAAGDDGSVQASDRWTLHSPSTSFEAAGLRPGHVVRLLSPSEHFRPAGALFGVAEVSGYSVTLRRLGMGVGLGEPAAPPGGLTQVSFLVTTLAPQLEQASQEVARLLGFRGNLPAGLPEATPSGNPLRDATVRLVLAYRFAALSHDGESPFPGRARLYEASYERLMSRLLAGGQLSAVGQPARLGARVIR